MSVRLGELIKVRFEAEVEGLFKQILRLLLFLRQAEVCHAGEVGPGGVEHDPVPLVLVLAGGVVTVDQLQVRQHPGLPVDGEVVRAVDELGDVDPGPVLLTRVAGGEERSPALERESFVI